jgi:hypothetical protein
MGVSPIERIGNSLIPWAVFRQCRIQEIHRYIMFRDAMQGIAPSLNLYLPPLNTNRYPGLHRLQKFFGSPVNGALGLVALFIKVLSEVALAIQECHTYHRYTQVGGASQSVSSQYP